MLIKSWVEINSPVMSLLGLQGLKQVLLPAVNTSAGPVHSSVVELKLTLLNCTLVREGHHRDRHIILFDLQAHLWDTVGLVLGHRNKASCNRFAGRGSCLPSLKKKKSTSVKQNKVKHNKTSCACAGITQKLGCSDWNRMIISKWMSLPALGTVS